MFSKSKSNYECHIQWLNFCKYMIFKDSLTYAELHKVAPLRKRPLKKTMTFWVNFFHVTLAHNLLSISDNKPDLCSEYLPFRFAITMLIIYFRNNS